MTDSPSLRDLRRDYATRTLTEADVGTDAMAEVARWLDEAVRAEVDEPNAFALATIGEDGTPASRIVLLRGLDTGLVFFTHYVGRKGRELARDPRAAALFFWPALERQLRVEGTVERIAPAESDAYFASRPRGSQLGAWASPQSHVIASRTELDASYAAAELRFEGQPVPRPETWGGYRLTPSMIELWQGGKSRLHDRLRYDRDGESWRRVRLAP